MSTLGRPSMAVPNPAPCLCEDGPQCTRPRKVGSVYCGFCDRMYPCEHATTTFSDGLD